MMTIHRGYWIAVLVISAWLVLAPAALAGPNFGEGTDDFTIRITLDKTMVAPGDTISVSGSGAATDMAVNVLIVPDPSSGANALTAIEVTPDADGKFSATLTVPDATETGRYAVRAEQPSGSGTLVKQYYWVGICVNECTGESLGSMLPETGGLTPTGAVASLILSGLLIGTLAVQGVRRARGI